MQNALAHSATAASVAQKDLRQELAQHRDRMEANFSRIEAMLVTVGVNSGGEGTEIASLSLGAGGDEDQLIMGEVSLVPSNDSSAPPLNMWYTL